MKPRKGSPRPSGRNAKHRHARRPSQPASSDFNFTRSTQEWLDFLAGLLVRAAREQHGTRVIGVGPVHDQPPS